MRNNDSRYCLITGATSGIGKAAACELARRGYKLMLVGRSRERTEAVQKLVQECSPESSPEIYVADLSSQNAIRVLANEILNSHQRIDILFNNAGGIFGERMITADGHEWTFGLNHLGYFYLTNLLLEPLKAAGNARIVNVSSQVHMIGVIDFDDMHSTQSYSPMKAYANSKLANILFTNELARRLAGTGVTVNAFHPGAVRTNFGRDLPNVVGMYFRHFGFLLRTPEKGAETGVWLASSDQVAGLSGKYFQDLKEAWSSRAARDASVAKKLWDVSASLTGLN